MVIPVSPEAAALLAALTHPNHLVRLSSWGWFLCRLAATPMASGIGIFLAIIFGTFQPVASLVQANLIHREEKSGYAI